MIWIQTPGSINKALLEHGHARLSRCLQMLSFYGGRTGELQQRLDDPQSIEYLLSDTLQKSRAAPVV